MSDPSSPSNSSSANKPFAALELFHQSPLEHFQEFVARQRASLDTQNDPEARALFEEAARRVEEALKRHI